jgi:hypothetical protein
VVSVVDQPTTAWTGDLVDALGVLGHERAVDALVGVLMGDNMPLRERAARALGMIGSRRALDPLRVVGEKHTGEGFWDRRIREAATNAVDRIEEMHPE